MAERGARRTAKPKRPAGTPKLAPSYARIHAVVRRIPRGKVATYGQVAARAGLAGQARRVGYALYALPAASPLPWHRVVNAQGELSVAGLDPDTGREQRIRLELEGVRFDARGRVPLERFGWKARAVPIDAGRSPR